MISQTLRCGNRRLLSIQAITAFLLILGPLTVAAQPNTDVETQAKALAALTQSYHSQGRFDGVVLVARNGTVLYLAGQGAADRERQLPNTPDTPYRICSITKQFTALLVMQLVQQGRLALDGHVTDYLPDFRQGTGRRITLRDLLLHTSGLAQLDTVLPEQNGVAGFYADRDDRFASAAYVIKTYLSGDLTRAPGEKFEYNNADYVVLSAILERVTGKTYARLLQERILHPLGMRHTGLITQDRFAGRQALGYVQRKDHLAPEPYVHIANFGAAGAMYSTAPDLLRWNRALDTDKLLTKKYREIMFTPQPGLGYEALSSWVYHPALPGIKPGPLLIERDGGIYAFSTLDLRAPDDGYSIILLSNTDTTDLGQIYARKGLAYDILKILYPSPPVESQ